MSLLTVNFTFLLSHYKSRPYSQPPNKPSPPCTDRHKLHVSSMGALHYARLRVQQGQIHAGSFSFFQTTCPCCAPAAAIPAAPMCYELIMECYRLFSCFVSASETANFSYALLFLQFSPDSKAHSLSCGQGEQSWWRRWFLPGVA